jgi:hypothetical protein
MQTKFERSLPVLGRSEPQDLYSIVMPPPRLDAGADLLNDARRLGLPRRSLDTIRSSFATRLHPTILSDSPAAEDRMGFHPTIRVLSDIVLSSATETPLAIGINGPWGSGKSSILKMVEDQGRALGFSCLSLNAWSLERNEHFVAAVASGIQDEIRQTGRRIGGEFLTKLSTFVAAALASLVPGGDVLRGLTATNIAQKRVTTEIKEVAAVASTQTSFSELVSLLLDAPSAGATAPERRRLLVIIDDVDRALPDQIPTILRNIKLILEERRCVFLMAMDMKIVAQAIDNIYGSEFGTKYLEKLVQISIRVPTLSREMALDYVRSMNVIDEIVEIVKWAPSEDILNPRRLKRYLNTMSVMLQLIIACGVPKEIDNRFALQALALRRDFHWIYNDLLRERRLDAWEAPGSDASSNDFNQRQVEFRKYLENLLSPPHALQLFEDFVNRTPLLNF